MMQPRRSVRAGRRRWRLRPEGAVSSETSKEGGNGWNGVATEASGVRRRSSLAEGHPRDLPRCALFKSTKFFGKREEDFQHRHLPGYPHPEREAVEPRAAVDVEAVRGLAPKALIPPGAAPPHPPREPR